MRVRARDRCTARTRGLRVREGEHEVRRGEDYESVNNFLDMERKLNKALAVLNQYN